MNPLKLRFVRSHRFALAVTLAIGLGLTGAARAVDTTWTFDGDGNWTDAANWDNGEPTNNTFDVFIDDGDTAVTVLLNVVRTINNLTLGDDDELSLTNGTDINIQGDLFNDGTLSLNSTASFTDLVVSGDGDLSLNGTGVVLMTGNVNNRITGNGTLTNTAMHTIAGTGQIGTNGLAINNAGLIDANIDGGVLFLDSVNAGSTNTGTMRASNGGLLQLTGSFGGSYDNTGGIIEAIGMGSQVELLNNAAIIGGTLQTSDNGVIQTNALQTTSLTDVTNAGHYIVRNGADGFIVGTINNTGTITVEADADQTELTISGDVTLEGGGTVQMTSLNGGTPTIDDGGDTGQNRLTNVDNTIQGSGVIGNNNMAMTNQAGGLVDANSNGGLLVLDPGSSPADAMTSFINEGAYRASNGGILRLTGSFGGDFDNTNGVIEAVGAGSQVQLTGGVSVTGGTLQSSGGGFIQTNDGQSTFLTDVTIDGDYFVRDNADAGFFGTTLTNQGTITIEADANETELEIGSNLMLTGGGTILLTHLDGGNAAINDEGGAQNRLTNVNNTIQGSGLIGQNNMALTNQAGGLIHANVTGETLVLDPGANPTDLMTSFINMGTYRASNGGILRLTGSFGGDFDNTGGTIEAVGADSQVQLTNGVSVTGGTLQSSAGGFIQTNVSQSTALTDVTINGDYFVRNNADAGFFGSTLTNQGTITIEADANETELEIGSQLTLTGGGTIQMTHLDGGSAVINDGGGAQNRLTNVNNTIQGSGQIGQNNMALTNQAGGLIHANVTGEAIVLDPGANPTDLMTSFINMGTYRASNGGILRLTGSFGGDFDNTGGTIEAIGAGSQVQLTGSVSVNGGTFQSSDGGFIQTNVSQDTFLTDVTIDGDYFVRNNADLTLFGTINNTGAITLDPDVNETEIEIGNDVMLTGGGTVKLTRPTTGNAAINDQGGAQNRLTNVDNTIEGTGLIGQNNMAFTNQAGGLVNANVDGETLLLDPGNSPEDADTPFINSGIYRASNGGTLSMTGVFGGGFANTNFGTFEALDGSTLQMIGGAALSNISGGVLDGGRYRVVAEGNGATMTLLGTPVTMIDGLTVVELSGAGSVLTVDGTPIEESLNNVSANLKILDNRDYTGTPGTFTIELDGIMELGGGTFSVPNTAGPADFTNAGQITGFGTIVQRPTNTGFIGATGGTLAFGNGIQGGSGEVTAFDGATVDVSGGAMDSSADFLTLIEDTGSGGGMLNLGTNNFLVEMDYANQNAGVGNSFNHRNNVTGAGLILADAPFDIAASGDVAADEISFGNVHVGDMVTKSYTVDHLGTPDESPRVRTAIQTAANGGNIDDARLSGAGVTASNLLPINAGESSDSLDVTFNATHAGALTGQSIHIEDNFDNVDGVDIAVTGSAYRFANPTDHTPEPVDFGVVHVGEVVAAQNLSITNDVPADGFSESLNAQLTSDGAPIVAGGSFANLAPGATDNTSLSVNIDTATAGAINGTATIALQSDGAGSSGLGITDLPSQTVNVVAQVNHFADPILNNFAGVGSLVMNAASQYTLDLGAINTGSGDVAASFSVFNDAPALNSDTLSGMWNLDGGHPAFGFAGFDDFADIAAQTGADGFTVTLIDDVAGDFMHSILLNPSSDNTSSQTALDPIELIIKGIVATPALTGSPDPVDFGAVLVGFAADQTVTAENTGDDRSTLSGDFGAVDSPFSPADTDAFGPLDDGETAMRDYTFAPNQRGAFSDDLLITSNAGDQTLELTGKGVAPVADTEDGDAGFVRLGTAATATAKITNLGDGNESGLGEISNLTGEIGSIATEFDGLGGLINLGDGEMATFDYTYTPTDRGLDNETVSVSFDNGNPDGTNTAVTGDVALSGQGVGPDFESTTHDPETAIDFGAIAPGQMVTIILNLSNLTDDPNGGDELLTRLSLLNLEILNDTDGLFEILNLASLPDALDKGGSFDLELKFNTDLATELGNYTAQLVLDTDENAPLGQFGEVFTWDLTGDVVPTPSAGVIVLAMGGLLMTRRRR